MSMMPQVSLERLLEGVDWSRCSGRELHRLAEGAAQAAVRQEGCRDHLRVAQPGLKRHSFFLTTTWPTT